MVVANVLKISDKTIGLGLAVDNVLGLVGIHSSEHLYEHTHTHTHSHLSIYLSIDIYIYTCLFVNYHFLLS